ncbi:hypothetical protein [Algoriphagus pacificus]|uniref:Uncharacterized protein n=1 Tax=Algoriphagus pacificus TaxID=2811234 RepID=A0ABS3CI83_9BACT|nr:hypothetical protein [Algoriphagus pacificus]MBN7816802.1 hypothetical protein [Algoriphagus pacificus]
MLNFIEGSSVKVITEDSVNNYFHYEFPKNVKYLGEVLEETPYGIIDKTKTGVGATTLELKATRNSIIVEPTKATASAKAKKTPNSLYVGSATHELECPTDEDIKNYFNNSSIPHKKIICVTDSLPRILDQMSEEQKEEYFLLIDESDSMQMDSSYRALMNIAMKIYKTFPLQKRALITATPVIFNDPNLSFERRIKLDFEEKKVFEIVLLHAVNPYGTIIELIMELVKQSLEDVKMSKPYTKIVVALNSVIMSKVLANKLSSLGISQDDISILCGSHSKGKAGKFNREIVDGILPSNINFKTSAYYNGIDIEESYHLIALTDNTDSNNSPSASRLTQIAGRCRVSLASFKIVQSFKHGISYPIYNLKDLQESAKNVVDLSGCMKHNIEGDKYLSNKLPKVLENSTKNLNVEGFRLTFYDKFDRIQKLEVSYLGIDAILELQDSRNTYYSSKDSLEKRLKVEGHTVISREHISKVKISGQTTIREINAYKKKMLINVLRKFEVNPFIFKMLPAEKIGKEGILISSLFEEYQAKMNHEQLIRMIKKASSPQSKKNFSLLAARLAFHFLEETSAIKALRDKYFKIGEKIYKDELTSIIEEFRRKSNIDVIIGTSELTDLDLLNVMCTIEPVNFNKKRIAKGARSYYKVIDHLPFGELIKKKTFNVNEYYEASAIIEVK